MLRNDGQSLNVVDVHAR